MDMGTMLFFHGKPTPHITIFLCMVSIVKKRKSNPNTHPTGRTNETPGPVAIKKMKSPCSI
jgi:hypothetical protein